MRRKVSLMGRVARDRAYGPIPASATVLGKLALVVVAALAGGLLGAEDRLRAGIWSTVGLAIGFLAGYGIGAFDRPVVHAVPPNGVIRRTPVGASNRMLLVVALVGGAATYGLADSSRGLSAALPAGMALAVGAMQARTVRLRRWEMATGTRLLRCANNLLDPKLYTEHAQLAGARIPARWARRVGEAGGRPPTIPDQSPVTKSR